MNTLDLIHRLREHQIWAQQRLLDAAAALAPDPLQQQFEIGPGSLLATLTHLYAADYVWLAAILGDPNPKSPFDIVFDDLSALREAWNKLDEQFNDFVGSLTEADLDQPVTKRSTLSLSGATATTPLGDVLLHLATHASYTMAQAKNIMRQLGVEPLPDVMLITLSREQARRRPQMNTDEGRSRQQG